MDLGVLQKVDVGIVWVTHRKEPYSFVKYYNSHALIIFKNARHSS